MKRLVIFFFLAINLFNITAQKPQKDYHLKHSLRQEGESYQFTVLDSDEKGVSRFHKDKFYYWFKTQKVLSTQGGASGALLHGAFEAFYDNKQLSQKGSFRKGLKHGEWIYWRPDGTIAMSEQWDNGRLSGKQKLYDIEGKQTETIHYKRKSNSRRTADSLVISNELKTKQTIYVFDNLGNVKSEERFKNGALDGKAKYYNLGKLTDTKVYTAGKPAAEKETVSREKKSLFHKKAKSSEVQEPRKKWFARKSEQPEKAKKEKSPKKEKTQNGKTGFFDFFKRKKAVSR